MKPALALPAALAARLPDLPARGPLLVPALCALALGIGLGAAWLAGNALTDATRRLEQAHALERRTSAELDAARALDARLANVLPQYQRLEQRGAVGRAGDAALSERALHTLAGTPLPAPGQARQGVKLRLSPPRMLTDAANAAPSDERAAGLHVVGRSLQVDAMLRHEGELLALLRRLEAERGPLMLTRGCRLDRLDPALREARAPTLRASCQVDALTIVRAAEAAQ